MILKCPHCGYETDEPDVDWLDSAEIVDELCDDCEREIYTHELVIP